MSSDEEDGQDIAPEVEKKRKKEEVFLIED